MNKIWLIQPPRVDRFTPGVTSKFSSEPSNNRNIPYIFMGYDSDGFPGTKSERLTLLAGDFAPIDV